MENTLAMQLLMKHAPQGLPRHSQLKKIIMWADTEFDCFNIVKGARKKAEMIRDSADKWKSMAKALRDRHEAEHVPDLPSAQLQELVDNVVIYSVELWFLGSKQEHLRRGMRPDGNWSGTHVKVVVWSGPKMDPAGILSVPQRFWTKDNDSGHVSSIWRS